MKNNCLVYISDNKCINMLKFSLHNYTKYNNYDIYILSDSYFEIDGCKTIVDLNLINFIKNNIKRYRISQLKWLIPSYNFFYDYDNVLYVDCDTEIKNNLDVLFNENIEDCEIFGVDDTVHHNNDYTNYIYYKELKKHNIDYNKNFYINSGVLLYNTKKFTKDYSFLKCKECIDLYNKLNLLLWDQDCVNIVYNTKCSYNYKYNYYIPLFKCNKNSLIDHYCCSNGKDILNNKISG